jgi:hypothetical protein
MFFSCRGPSRNEKSVSSLHPAESLRRPSPSLGLNTGLKQFGLTLRPGCCRRVPDSPLCPGPRPGHSAGLILAAGRRPRARAQRGLVTEPTVTVCVTRWPGGPIRRSQFANANVKDCPEPAGPGHWLIPRLSRAGWPGRGPGHRDSGGPSH